jgi:hypothetical protein
MLTIFHHPKAKSFCLASLLAKTKKMLLRFLARKLSILRTMKNHQPQSKGKPHTQEKS